jgi:glycosyltransferase involved in cell wall biosynthesis
LEAIRIAELAGIRLRIAAKMREDDESEYFEEVVQPALGSNAEYVGELSTEEKYELMGSSCALLNPIQWDEPFGLVMIEALASGTPIIGFRRASVPEVVEDAVTGYVVDDVETMTDRIGRLSEIHRLACRQTAERRFGVTRMADDYERHYAALVRSATVAG